jgi:hypothetical protein
LHDLKLGVDSLLARLDPVASIPLCLIESLVRSATRASAVSPESPVLDAAPTGISERDFRDVLKDIGEVQPRLRESTMSQSLSMGSSMARRTEGDQILLNVTSQLASKLNVMNLQGLHSSTILAPPAVSLEDFAAQAPVFFRVKL